jgi:hypothetical protein
MTREGSTMSVPILILAEPKEVFPKIAAHSPWFPPFALCVVCFFVVAWLGGCWTSIREGLQWGALLGPAIASILFVALISVGSTAMLYVVFRAIRGHGSAWPSYKTLFSLNTHCALILILGELINVLLVRADLIHLYNPALPNRFPLGLDLLILGAKEPNIYLSVLLHGTSVFILWYLVVLAKGLSYVTGSSPARAAAIAATLWLVGIGFAIGIIYSAGGGTIFRITL